MKTTKTAAKKTPAKKTAAKKAAPAGKAPAKKTPAKKAPAKKAPAKKAARAVPKTSPLAGMSIADYTKRLSGWQATAVAALTKLVRAIAPGATASIKWGQPVFEENGPFAFIRPAKGHLTFGFWRGSEIDDPSGVFEGDGSRMKHVKLRGLSDLDESMLGAMVRQAVALNREKGTPTRRA
jgi:hypothetical protein